MVTPISTPYYSLLLYFQTFLRPLISKTYLLQWALICTTIPHVTRMKGTCNFICNSISFGFLLRTDHCKLRWARYILLTESNGVSTLRTLIMYLCTYLQNLFMKYLIFENRNMIFNDKYWKNFESNQMKNIFIVNMPNFHRCAPLSTP